MLLPDLFLCSQICLVAILNQLFATENQPDHCQKYSTRLKRDYITRPEVEDAIQKINNIYGLVVT